MSLNDTNLNNVLTDETVEVYKTFEEMNLSSDILQGIYAYGFEKPSAIQMKGIVPFLNKRDLIAQSQSGTGKTATFVIGMLQCINKNDDSLQAIILAPTRELAKQIFTVTSSLSSYMNLKINTVIGGMRRSKYSYDYGNSYQIIVGTPGRLSDLIGKKLVDTSKIKVLIMDEADEMLSQGFREQLVKILRNIPSHVQIGLFSATIPEEMMKITTKFMNNPLKILVKPGDVTLKGIKQYYVAVESEEDKFHCLCDLYSTIRVTQSIIYVNHKSTIEWLTKNMMDQNFTVGCISGSMTTEERNDVMTTFRAGDLRVLISTDLLSRGIDVQQVSLIINYDMPFEKETYIHRIGRSGRFGRKGVAINLIGQKDYKNFKKIIDYYETTIEELPSNISNLI
tara:strand:+ start:102 stop:1286 length:1185 start_codon:yes stop_codon:yes gene_type:complete